MNAMRRQGEHLRGRWTSRYATTGRDEIPMSMYAAARRRPLSAASEAHSRMNDERALGPYETSYDVSRGYALERTIIQP
jgi:hypothetical protein